MKMRTDSNITISKQEQDSMYTLAKQSGLAFTVHYSKLYRNPVMTITFSHMTTECNTLEEMTNYLKG